MTEQPIELVAGYNKRICSPAELAYWLSRGLRCFAHWNQSPFGFQTAPGLVVAVSGDCVLIDHWGRSWHRFDDPAFQIRQGYLVVSGISTGRLYG